jgi:predicted RNase H-like nuclease (RuvC/YqgF family)
MAKILTIATIALATITALLGLLNRNTLVQTKTDLAAAQGEVAATKKSLEETNAKLADSQKSVAEWTSKNEASQAEVAKLKAEVEAKQSDIELAKTQQNTINTENEMLKGQVADLKAEGEKLNQEITTLKDEPVREDLEQSKIKVKELETLNEQLTANLDSAKNKANDLESQLAEKKRVQKANDLSGRILAVNEAWNFVVLNVGDKSGVASNTELLVKRGNTRIGRVRITSVEPASSIADIIPGSLANGLSIQPGDYVVTEYVAN